MKKGIFNILLLVLAIGIVLLLFKNNITFKKEEPNESNTKVLNLEVESDLIKGVYSKLTLLDDSLNDDAHHNLYFNFDQTKTLTNEDKLYIAFESLYDKKAYKISSLESDKELLEIDIDTVKKEVETLFNDTDFNPLDITYTISRDCGIVDYLFTGQEYKLTLNKCNPKKIERIRIENAYKDGDFIKLKIKAYYAIQNTESQKDKDKYLIMNYHDDKKIFITEKENIDNKFDLDEINTYTFAFKLKDEEYYLDNISK